ncbi:MAG: rRNA adenine dimethyltransferase family protein, partial [Anaerolineales bacterium]|nr:rRNA adenine dimethyltransferase family protein [Anaerolineales bacterium]
SDYRVVANIPYNITSAVIRKLIEAESTPDLVVLTVQREVAKRIVAEPGEMSLLALSVQLYGNPSLEGNISRNAFYPSPDVDSAVLKINLKPDLPLSADEVDRLFNLARAGFQQRRKQLRNSLGHGTSLSREEVDQVMEAAGVSPKRRPQSLSVTEWIELTRRVSSFRRQGES